jgi:DNA repair protein RadC
MPNANSTRPPTRRRGDDVIAHALRILERRLRRPGVALASPGAVRDYLRLRLSECDRECFLALLLDAQNCLIAAPILACGSLTELALRPREVVRTALAHNASAIIVAHNHVSGHLQPSVADREFTATLRQALALVDVRLLDHFIVGGRAEPLSFAERDLL